MKECKAWAVVWNDTENIRSNPLFDLLNVYKLKRTAIQMSANYPNNTSIVKVLIVPYGKERK